jgi:uncharacterized protein
MHVSHRTADSPLQFSMRDLARRPGQQRIESLEFPAPTVFGTDVIGVPPGADVKLEVSFESVTDGIWVSGTVTGEAVGECGRCLDEVRLPVAAPVQGLFLYPEASREDGEEDELDDVFEFDGDTIDLEQLTLDAVATELPFTPLCDPDCPGLCDQCGARFADDPDHAHEAIDPRWSTLQSLTEPKES